MNCSHLGKKQFLLLFVCFSESLWSEVGTWHITLDRLGQVSRDLLVLIQLGVQKRHLFTGKFLEAPVCSSSLVKIL